MLCTNPDRTKLFTISPTTAKVALDRQTSGLRVSRHGKVTVGAYIVGAVLSIVASTKTSKTLSKKRSRTMNDRGMEKSSWGRYYWPIVTHMHDKRLVVCNGVFIQTIFWVNCHKRGQGV